MKWRYPHTVLALSLGAFFVTLFARLSISTVVPQLTTALESSKSAIGLALTGMWMASALVQYPSGVFGDRFGEREVVVASLALTAAGALFVALSPHYLGFFLFVVVLGVGTGLYVPVSTSLLSELFENTGQALSVHIAGGNLAGLVAPVAAAFVAVRYGWRAAPFLCAVVALPLLVAFPRWVDARTPAGAGQSVRDLFDPGRGVDVLTRPRIVYSAALGAVGLFTFQAITSFFPTFLVEYHGVGIQRAGLLFGVVFVLSVVSLPLVGKVGDAVDNDAAIVLSYAVLAAGLSLSLFLPSRYSLVVAVVPVGAGISWGGALQSRYLADLSTAERGTGFGLILTVTGLVGSLGSVTVGALADHWGWVAGYGVVVALLVLAAVSLLSNRALRLGL